MIFSLFDKMMIVSKTLVLRVIIYNLLENMYFLHKHDIHARIRTAYLVSRITLKIAKITISPRLMCVIWGFCPRAYMDFCYFRVIQFFLP